MGNVQMSDYEGLGGGWNGGFGASADAPSILGMSVEQFVKSLSANYQSPRMDGSAALRVESLEATMRVLTSQPRHVKLFYDLPKGPAYSTVHEWNSQTSYGVETGGFTRAGEAAPVQDSNYIRKSVFLKFLTTQREVDHPTSLVRSNHGNVIANYTKDGAMWLMRACEKALFFGNSDIVAEEFDGFLRQLQQDTLQAATNIVDLRGGPLRYEDVSNGANVIEEAYGEASDLYLSPKALTDLGNQQATKERIVLPAPREGVIGMPLKAIATQSSEINLKKDIFLRPGKDGPKKFAPTVATATRAPSAPTVAGTITASQGTQFTAADIGTYQYRVTAVNRFGESAYAQESGGVAVTAAADRVNLAITDGGGEAATGYRIYRSLVGAAAGTEQFVFAVKRAGATTTAYDTNRWLPGCGTAFLFQMNEEAVGIVQLAPMFKVELATQALSKRWIQGMYLAAVLRAPGKIYVFTNVADD